MSRFVPHDWGRNLEAPLQALQGELNRLFRDYWDPGRTAQPERSPTDLDPVVWTPPVDLHETDQEWILRVDLPGVDPSSVDLSLTGAVLTLRGERSDDGPKDHERRLRERPVGPFLRHVTLPEGLSVEGIQAECKLGVLTVHLPKRDHARPRTIPIQPN